MIWKLCSQFIFFYLFFLFSAIETNDSNIFLEHWEFTFSGQPSHNFSYQVISSLFICDHTVKCNLKKNLNILILQWKLCPLTENSMTQTSVYTYPTIFFAIDHCNFNFNSSFFIFIFFWIKRTTLDSH